MNVFLLKSIALITMIIDHYGAIFQSSVITYRIIGRLAFPIYAFLLVEGYFHSKNIKRYATRLFLFAFVSEMPFDLAFYNGVNFTHQNIFFTLFIGLYTMYFLENKEKYKVNTPLVLGFGILLATLFSVDYSFIGIIYILSFYYTRNLKPSQRLFSVGLSMFLINLISLSYLQNFALLALPLIFFYNGELGPKNKFIQLFFYISYPLHLIIFYLIQNPSL